MAHGGPTSLDHDDERRERVRLALPPGGPAAALARAAAVTLGRQAGFGRTTIGNLTLAVDETLVLVLPTTEDGIDLEVVVGDGTLAIVASSRRPATALDPRAVARFNDVVDDLVSSASVDRTNGVVVLEVVEHPGAADQPATDTATDPARGDTSPSGGRT